MFMCVSSTLSMFIMTSEQKLFRIHGAYLNEIG